MTGPRVLVTGAAGFIGSHLCRALAATGAAVVALDSLRSNQGWAHLDGGEERVEADLAAGLPVAGPVDAVFHLASLTDTTETDTALMERQNVGGFRRLLESVARWGAPLVYASSASVYGHGAAPQRVGALRAPQNPYAESKVALEDEAAAAGGGPKAGLRFFNVFGTAEGHKGASASMVTRVCRQTVRGLVRIFADGSQSRDFVPVESVVEACVSAWRGGADGVFNVGTGQAVSFNRLVAIAAEEIGPAEVERFACPFPFFQEATQASLTAAERVPGWEPVADAEACVRAHARTFPRA